MPMSSRFSMMVRRIPNSMDKKPVDTPTDEMENLDSTSLAAGAGILDTFGRTVLDTSVGPNIRPEKKLQAGILREMSALDPERAIIAMKAWATFVQLASQTRNAPFETLAEYVPARVIDAGEL